MTYTPKNITAPTIKLIDALENSLNKGELTKQELFAATSKKYAASESSELSRASWIVCYLAIIDSGLYDEYCEYCGV